MHAVSVAAIREARATIAMCPWCLCMELQLSLHAPFCSPTRPRTPRTPTICRVLPRTPSLRKVLPRTPATPRTPSLQSATADASDAKDARHDGASPLGLAFLEFFHNYSWVCIEALLRMHLLCKLPQFHPVLQDPIRAQIPKGWVKVEACEPCCCC